MFSLNSCFFYNYSLFCAIVAGVLSQVLKVLCFCIVEKRFDKERLFGAGGMPSAHSAVVVALSVAVSRQCGVGSPNFAISAVFAAIVMYDANGVRRSSGDQAKILNRLIYVLDISDLEKKELRKSLKVFNKNTKYDENMKVLKEQIGHTPIEVLAGVFIGVFVALVIPF